MCQEANKTHGSEMLKIIAVYNLKWMLECLKPHKEPVVQALDRHGPSNATNSTELNWRCHDHV